MRVCPNRGQSCGKPKECGWKLFLRGAESTRRCVSVAFLRADKRCLENCRNFSHRAAGWREGRGDGKRERERERKRHFRPAKRTRFSRGGTLTQTARLAPQRERERERSIDRSIERDRKRKEEHPPDRADPRDPRGRRRAGGRIRRARISAEKGGKEGRGRNRRRDRGCIRHAAQASLGRGLCLPFSFRVSRLAPGSYSHRLWQFPRRTL